MRILCLNPYLPPPLGGIEKEMLAIAGELLALGHELTLLTTTACFPRGRNARPPSLDPGLSVVRREGYLRSALRGFAPAAAPILVPGMSRAACRAEPELVLVFNVGWGPALRPVMKALRGRAPILFRSYYHPPGGALALAKKRYLLSSLDRADVVLAATSGEATVLREGGLAHARVEVVPPGVHQHERDANLVRRLARAHNLEGQRAIAHVARLSRFKGTLDLIEVLPELRARLGHDVILLLIGADHSGGGIERRIAELGLGSAVRLAGEVSDDRELRALLASSALFALPSHYEAFGIAYIEAMAEGLAVVGCDVGGVREAIGDAGALIPSFGDRRQLLETLADLLDDPGRRSRMGERGRARVMSGLTWRHAARRFLDIGAEVRAERNAV